MISFIASIPHNSPENSDAHFEPSSATNVKVIFPCLMFARLKVSPLNYCLYHSEQKVHDRNKNWNVISRINGLGDRYRAA